MFRSSSAHVAATTSFNFVAELVVETHLTDFGTIRSFQRREYEVIHWKIDQFSRLSEEADFYYDSPHFDFRGHDSYLRFYPKVTNNEKEFFSLWFFSSNHKHSFCVHLTMGVKTQSGRIENYFSKYIFFPNTSGFDASHFILRSKFIERKEELAPSDCVTFVIFLSTDAHQIIRDVPNQTEKGQAEDDEGKSEKKGSEKVLSDISDLLESGNLSDAIVVVEGIEYKVHSCILATRTPVFAAMFNHDCMEKLSKKITINDCESATFKEFLKYIYTGGVENLTLHNAFGLYRMADKYLVKDLKDVCRQCIEDNISSETFCEMIQLALKCRDNALLETAFDYCAMHIRLIIRSVEWQRYITENPIEANEILIKSLGPL